MDSKEGHDDGVADISLCYSRWLSKDTEELCRAPLGEVFRLQDGMARTEAGIEPSSQKKATARIHTNVHWWPPAIVGGFVEAPEY